MPQKTETISVPGYDEATIAAIAYGTLVSLEWKIEYAFAQQLIAYTPRSWNKFDHEINIGISGEQLTVTSKSIHGEIADLPGRNKKFVATFLQAFEAIKNDTKEGQVNGWKEKISSLETNTNQAVNEATQQAAEIDKVMNLSDGNIYLTYAIIAINIIVFILMAVSGVHLISPTGLDIIRWGGNHASFTLSGDWWRLLSCVFVHIGIIHLLFNMYALLMIGAYLEPMLGKARFIAAYLATGICASLASLWWHSEPVASAGASGAIFGMYGVFLALLSTKLIPKQVRDQLLKSIGIFIGFNLLYGMKAGADNAAHIGGLLSGLVIGYIFYLGWKGENTTKKKMTLSLAVLLAAAGLSYFYLQNNKGNDIEKAQLEYFMKSAGYKDSQKFAERMDMFVEIEKRALEPLADNASTEAQRSKKLDSLSLPEWDQAANLVEKMKDYDIAEVDKKRVILLEEYIRLRKEEITAIRNILNEKSPENQNALVEVNNKIANLFEEMQRLQ